MGNYATRPVVMGTRGVVTSGHYLATAAGFRIMERGGNAIDAGAAMCFCLNVLEPQQSGIGGEAPILIYSQKEGRVFSISGVGWSPKSLTLEWFRQQRIDLIPGDGYLPACVPAVVGTWAVALARFGTMTFAEILEPAIQLVENGFPIYAELQSSIEMNRDKLVTLYPDSGAIYCPNGRIPEIGQLLVNHDLAKTFRILCRAEKNAQHKGRIAGIEAASNAFYKEVIAEEIANFISTNPVWDSSGATHSGMLSYEDIAHWNATFEKPVSYNYQGFEIHKCGPWTQGPVFLQQLAILEGFDLKKMGHNSAEYLHTLIETAKLAFADREAYYGDPEFDSVALDVLLSEPYSARRRSLIHATASTELQPGDIGCGIPFYATSDVIDDNRRALNMNHVIGDKLLSDKSHFNDTTHLDSVDHLGNMVACTPSGGWFPSSPVIRGLGFPLGTRGQMFYLNPNRPNALEPNKRPRATLTPSLVTQSGKPVMVFGTPGGDSQDQWSLQFFLNHIVFGMDLQESLDAPTVHSNHFPSSFYPRIGHRGQAMAEECIDNNVIQALEQRGHKLVKSKRWSHGKVMAIKYDHPHSIILGGASHKGSIGYALAW